MCIGNKSVNDALDVDECNSIIVKGMKTRGKELLLNSEHFSLQKYKDSGAFFNKNFWNTNLLWSQAYKGDKTY